MAVVLDTRVRLWCPACRVEAVRPLRPNSTEMHTCPKMGFLAVPLLPYGTKAKVQAHEREDYIGREQVRLNDEGRPVMSITTTRDDGQDCVVFAPTATTSVTG